MKKLLVLSLLFSINFLSLAQEPVAPLRLSKNLLVHSAGLPEEFLLFAPDSATQVAFNPARAMNLSDNFIYANYFSDNYSYVYNIHAVTMPYYEVRVQPTNNLVALQKGMYYEFPNRYEENYYSSKNPSFSAFALINDGDAKWFISLSNGISLVNNEVKNLSERNGYYYDQTQKELINEKSIDDMDETATALRVLRIWKSGETNYSIGLNGIVLSDNYERTRVQTREYSNTLTSGGATNRLYRTNETNDYLSTYDLTRFNAAIEFGLQNPFIDYIGTLSIEFVNNPKKYNMRNYAERWDSSFYSSSVSFYEERNRQFGEIKSSPLFFNFENYFRHTVNWITPGDDLFFTVNAFYSTDEKSFEYDGTRFSNNNGTISENKLTSSAEGSYDSKGWGFSFSAGYSLNATIKDLFILSGAKIHGMYLESEDLDASFSSTYSTTSYTETLNKSNAGIQVPVYVNFTPAQWFSAFGGLTYSYYYNLEDIEYTSDNVSLYSYDYRQILIRQNNETNRWYSAKSIYIGCELRHDSGFKAQFYFDQDIASVRNWNVSLGYHF